MPSLKSAVAVLASLYPMRNALTDPLQLILWENIGYLIDDERRAALFAEFGERVGFGAAAIVRAPQAVLMALAARGGMRTGTRVDCWREIGRLALSEGAGEFGRTLKALPLPKARALLKKFPGIGDPGADKVLLFAGIAPRPSLDSNGLRTLVRLGLCAEEKSYSATYRAGSQILGVDADGDAKWLIAAYIALREHGKAVCKRGKPLCFACPLDGVCAHVPVRRL
jgi:endonuclease III